MATLRIVRELREELSLSEEEYKLAEVVENEESGTAQWKEGKVPDKELDIGPKAASIIYGALEKLDKNGELREGHLDLCDEFEYTGD